MVKLKEIIKQYGRWSPLEEYVQRIEYYQKLDFSISIENSKALLESIAKEICTERGQTFVEEDSPAKLLKLAFGAVGVQPSTIGPQIAVALSTIGQNMGELRNEIGAISHGRTMEELQAKKEAVEEVTRDFLILSTEIIACFLIRYFEVNHPRVPAVPQKQELIYDQCVEFNDHLDENYGEFSIGLLSYPASEILFNTDYESYKTAFEEFLMDPA